MYYLCSETKALISFGSASLFSHMQKAGFLTTRLMWYIHVVCTSAYTIQQGTGIFQTSVQFIDLSDV